jgi:hypothetical protein
VRFAPKENAKILSGIILPTTLVNAFNPNPASDFERDISVINKRSEKPWAGFGTDFSSYGYTGTNYRQIRKDTFQVRQERVDPREEARRRRQQQRGNQIAQQRQFITADGGQLQTFEIRVAASDLSSTVQIADGNVVLTGIPPTVGGDIGTAASTTQAGAEKSVVYPMTQSDFVDPKTGATLTLLQIENRDLTPWLSRLALGEGVKVANQVAGNATYYTAEKPVKVGVLTWQLGQTRMALVSTSLDKDQLVEIAGTIKASR